MWTGFKILVMLQESEINLPWQNNIKDKKHDTSSSTGSDAINGVHHSFIPLQKKNSHLAFYQLLVTLHVQTSLNQNSYVSCWWQVLMSSSQSILNIFKNIQNKATQGKLLKTYYCLTSWDTKEKEDRKKSLQRTYQPKFLVWVSTPM